MFDRSYWQAAEKFVADSPTEPRTCEMAGCAATADFKAPKSPQDLRSFRWFCLPHVQEYNKAWDYYKGMNIAQMEQVRREDVVGWRPTWPLGYLRPGQEIPDAAAMKQHVFNQFFGGGKTKPTSRAKATPVTLSGEEQGALQRLGLSWPVSLYEAKQRYRELVKKHHPDTVTDAAAKTHADELIKLINRAYAVVKKKLKG